MEGLDKWLTDEPNTHDKNDGTNIIYHGDCLELMEDINDNSIDMILCDLPYGTTACKWDSVIPFDHMWKQYKRLIKDCGAIVLFASQPFTSALIMSNPTDFNYCWVWDKVTARGHLVAKYRPMQQSEDIVVFSSGKHNYYPIMIERPKDKWKTSKEFKKTDIIKSTGETEYKVYKHWFPKNILQFSNANATNEKPLHPTQKPVALMEYLIKTYTKEGQTVLDNCIGSGTTAIACLNTNRNFIGIEKDDKYFEIATKRVAEWKPTPKPPEDLFSQLIKTM